MPDYKRMMLIINPAAGRSGYSFGFGEAMKILDDGGYRTELFFTKGRGDATEFAEKYADEFDVAACIGGDGTLSEMITGIMHTGKRKTIAYFPMGTANDVAGTLGIPKSNCPGAARRIIEGKPHPFDVGGFGPDRYFSYIAAFGAFTEVSYSTPQNQKKALGHLAYVLQGAASLQKIEPVNVRVEYDGGVIEDKLVYGSLSNSTSVAGIVKLNEEMVCLGDGMSELVLVREAKNIDGYGEIISSVLSRKFDSENLKILHTTRAKFTFEKPVAWTCDGEDGGSHTEIELCNYKAPVDFIF